MTAYAGHAHTATPVAIGNRGGYTNIFVGTNGARIVRLRDDSTRLVSRNRKLGPFYLSTNMNRAKVEDQSSKDGARPVHGFGAKKSFPYIGITVRLRGRLGKRKHEERRGCGRWLQEGERL